MNCEVLFSLLFTITFVDARRKRDLGYFERKVSNKLENKEELSNEVMEIVEENMMNFRGPMVLVSKTNAKEDESGEDTKEGEEGFHLNSDDEAVAYYSNIMVKKFYTKPISGNLKNNLEKKPMTNVGAS